MPRRAKALSGAFVARQARQTASPVFPPAATKKRNSDSPCATYPPCTGLALSGLQSERLKLTPLTGDAALDDEDANQRSSEIRLLPKPRLAYKDIIFEPEQPVLPKETLMNAKPEFFLVDTNGIRLRVAQAGKGPLIVLVHGWPESWYSWRHQIPPLAAAGYRVAAIDVRGYGGSDKPEPIEAYSIKEMCTDIVGLIDGLGEKEAILIGHDWGAPIVWNTSLFFPDKVRAVAGLSVPHTGRGPAPRIQLFRNLYKDQFFYQLLALYPPSTTCEAPVIKEAFSEHIHTTASAISSGIPTRRMGTFAMISSKCASIVSLVIGVSM